VVLIALVRKPFPARKVRIVELLDPTVIVAGVALRLAQRIEFTNNFEVVLLLVLKKPVWAAATARVEPLV